MSEASHTPDGSKVLFSLRKPRTGLLIGCTLVTLLVGWFVYDVLLVRLGVRWQIRQFTEIATVGQLWEPAKAELVASGYEIVLSSPSGHSGESVVVFKPVRTSRTLWLAWKLALKMHKRQLYLDLFGVTKAPVVYMDSDGKVLRVVDHIQ